MRLDAVVTWLWAPPRGYRSSFGPEQVNVLASMVRRHYRPDVAIKCVTDMPEGIDPSIEVIPAWNDFADVPSPHGGKNPSCYRRLRIFHPDAEEHFGKRFISLDLDVVMTGDVTPIFDGPEDFKAWGDTNPLPGSHYNGSMIRLTAGARPQVWTSFDPRLSPGQSARARCFGSDQGWISYCLGPGEARWTTADGVYSFRNHIAKTQGRRKPDDAVLVSFHGRFDPWDACCQTIPWIREHYR